VAELNPFLPKVWVSFVMSNCNNVNCVFLNDENNAKGKSLSNSGFPEILKGGGELKRGICNPFEGCDKVFVEPFAQAFFLVFIPSNGLDDVEPCPTVKL